MSFYIYKITNLINGKIYIGKTNNLIRRWGEHLKHAKAGKPYPIHRAISKYGAENFSKEIIGTYFDEHDSLQGEIELISLYKANDMNIGYNLTTGGDGVVGYTFTKEAKRKISKAMTGKTLSEEHKENIAIHWTVEKRSEHSKLFQGEKGFSSKLTEKEVKEIKQLLKNGLSTRTIAKMFNVGKTIIGYIGSGKRWNHISI